MAKASKPSQKSKKRRARLPKVEFREARPYNDTPENRVKVACQEAKRIMGVLESGDVEALVQATLLQGVASGDIIAASITAKLRLQNENLRLKQRLEKTKLAIQQQKLRAMEKLNSTEATPQQLLGEIAKIYGLAPAISPSYMPSNFDPEPGR